MPYSLVFSYFQNCFLLIIPVLAWNVLLYKKLPSEYQHKIWDDIPGWLSIAENISRVPVFGFPLFLKLEISDTSQIAGLIIYICGTIIYFASWLIQIFGADALRKKNICIFAAPAYTSFIWLAGISITGKNLTIGLPYSFSIYLSAALIFTSFHTLHACLVFKKLKTGF